MQGGKPSGSADLIEFFRFAEVLRFAAFATDSLAGEAFVLGATQALGDLLQRTPDELTALRLGDLVEMGSGGRARSDLTPVELRHADGRSVPVLVTARRLSGESAPWIWFVFACEPPGRRVVALARQLVHEVSNPLTSVVCRLELVARQFSQLVPESGASEDLGRHLATAQEGAERVISLVRQFADSLDDAPEGCTPALRATLPPSSHRRSKRE